MESRKAYAVDISQSKICLGKETDTAHFPQNLKSKVVLAINYSRLTKPMGWFTSWLNRIAK
ncbi:MAG: hypothetical protein HC903_26965 [Methylacidiphilales bacterium]|nr:hypothetical protein [Candidatus Methylacidiphilales bacterium]